MSNDNTTTRLNMSNDSAKLSDSQASDSNWKNVSVDTSINMSTDSNLTNDLVLSLNEEDDFVTKKGSLPSIDNRKFSPQLKMSLSRKQLTPFGYVPPKPDSQFLVSSNEINKDECLHVYLNNLTKCDIVLNPLITKKEIILSAMEKFGLDTKLVDEYNLSLWVEHKTHTDISENPYKDWEINNGTSKFHLHRTRTREKRVVNQLGPDMSTVIIPVESDSNKKHITVDKTEKPIGNQSVTFLTLITNDKSFMRRELTVSEIVDQKKQNNDLI